MPTLSAVLAVVGGVLAVTGALALGEVLDADALVLARLFVTLHPAARDDPRGPDDVCAPTSSLGPHNTTQETAPTIWVNPTQGTKGLILIR